MSGFSRTQYIYRLANDCGYHRSTLLMNDAPRDSVDRRPDHVQQLADFKRALDHAAIVATTDVTGRITYVNDKFVEISGYSREELIGQDHRIINSSYHSKEFIRDLWRTIANGEVWHGELRNRAKGGQFYWVDTTIVPFLDTRGKPYQYIAIRADITARKAAEERLAQQAALARVGQMAAVVAHEVRNPLAGIKGAIQVLMSRRAADDSELPVMRDIVGRIDSLSELINDLMVFARPRPPRLAVVELHAILADAITIVRRDPSAHGVEISVEGDDVPVTADGELVRATVRTCCSTPHRRWATMGGSWSARAVGTARRRFRSVTPGPGSRRRSAIRCSSRSLRRRRGAGGWDCRLRGAQRSYTVGHSRSTAPPSAAPSSR